MNPFLAFLIRLFIATPIAAITGLTCFFGFDMGFFFTSALSIASFAVTYMVVKAVMTHRFIKAQGLTRKEYKYIEKNLDEAKEKINRLNKALFSRKGILQLKQNLEILRVVRKIYTITKKEPRRFYLGERFYFSHLDSFVELAEKYAFLSVQPTKNKELNQSLLETKRTMEQLTRNLEKDLDQILSTDINQLHLEIDVAKHSIKTFKDNEMYDESRRLK